jgi:hypothetical protein
MDDMCPLNYQCDDCGGRLTGCEFQLTPPTDEQIREDNPHFGPTIRVVEKIEPYEGMFPERFSYMVTVGARNSVIKAYLDGEKDRFVDAWATYLWDHNQGAWKLGAN